MLYKTALLTTGLSVFLACSALRAEQNTEATSISTTVNVSTTNETITDGPQVSKTEITQFVEVALPDGKKLTFDFYGDNIFRIFQDNSGEGIRDPKAEPPAQILVNNPRRPVTKLDVTEKDGIITISTGKIEIQLNKETSTFKIINSVTKEVVVDQTEPTLFEKGKTSLTLKAQPDEYFYGGGVQNGRFSHKGKTISIENQNSWTDGGVASPTPFYWSTKGYGVMWYTFKKGQYDFGSKDADKVNLYHEEEYLDVFFMVNDGAVPLLQDFYQLTGNPVLLPKFAFYEGHLNAYNRDYWRPSEDDKGTLFEDGKLYKEGGKDNGGVRESLNGELEGNYQFSARAVIDRYKAHDMPLGWLLPNDGYGAGYGQEETLDDNIANLRKLTEYAHKEGVEIGLWTQSDLHPKPDVSALLQRDLIKEVKDAGVRVLKTDVAWVGPGYSFGLNGIADAAEIMTKYGNDSRPFIISLDGWAGTQRYAGIWSGDQTGGVWEYIRFHVPTYIGSGLSGQPNISSDMDGIFGGKNAPVLVRDFQWKTYTPMELNMDGWGSNAKYPHIMGEPATSINRWYLKLKSELIPYTYSIAEEAVTGLPIVRALFLEYPNPYTLGKATQYQYLYGPFILVAPIYQATKADEEGNDIRNNVYLPEGQWIDYFSGELYDGGKIYNNLDMPLWKLPVFIKNGAIIPLANPNNNVTEIDKSLRIIELYPHGESSFTLYDDDGLTEAYKLGKSTKTLIESKLDDKGTVTVTIHPTTGEFSGFINEQSTEFRVNVTEKPSSVSATVGDKKVALSEAASTEEFASKDNVYFYDKAPNINRFATKDSEFAKKVITKNPVLHVKLAKSDVTSAQTVLTVEGFQFKPANTYLVSTGKLEAPAQAQVTEENTAPYTLTPSWDAVKNADYYEIEFDNMLYTTIKDTDFLFTDLAAETPYSFKLRAVNRDGASDWTTITATTKSNPLEFAIPNITGETTAENQGNSLTKLFDWEEGDTWHTKYGQNSLPFDLIMDLKTVNKLEKLTYVPREDAGNGTLLKGTIYYSMDKENWTEVGAFEWAKNNEVKVVEFKDAPSARFIKFVVTDGVGGYGSGKEIYVFKVPGTESYIPGDINNDGKIDQNDLTSYRNYTGLRKGDGDFEGYISNGDINKNDLIDAYDISVVTTQLDGGVDPQKGDKVEGTLTISTPKADYKTGETVEITVKGNDLKAVNALSFSLPYIGSDYEFIGIEGDPVKGMENLTNDRLHSNGAKVLYPTFANVGKKDVLNGTNDILVIKLKAKRDLKFDLKLGDGILVDKDLNYKKL